MSPCSVGIIHPVNERRDNVRPDVRPDLHSVKIRRAWPSIGINPSFRPAGLVTLGYEIFDRE